MVGQSQPSKAETVVMVACDEAAYTGSSTLMEIKLLMKDLLGINPSEISEEDPLVAPFLGLSIAELTARLELTVPPERFDWCFNQLIIEEIDDEEERHEMIQEYREKAHREAIIAEDDYTSSIASFGEGSRKRPPPFSTLTLLVTPLLATRWFSPLDSRRGTDTE